MELHDKLGRILLFDIYDNNTGDNFTENWLNADSLKFVEGKGDEDSYYEVDDCESVLDYAKDYANCTNEDFEYEHDKKGRPISPATVEYWWDKYYL